MSERYLTPKKGLVVLDPATLVPLPEDGARVQGNDEHWIRRINEGDVIERPVKQAKEKTP